jgi:OOP family OmpA-OmpF porin
MQRLIISCCIGCFIFFGHSYSAPAFSDPIKFYIGAGGGLSHVDTGISSTTGSASSDGDDTGFKGLIGARVTKYFAVESFYANLGKSVLTGNSGDTFVSDGTTFVFTANNVSIESEGTTLGAAAIGTLPVTDNINLLGKIGLHRWDIKTEVVSSVGNADFSDDGTNLYFGGGLEINVLSKYWIRAEFERFEFDDDDVDLISVNLIVNF